MTEQEIFEKLKEALDYEYLCTDWGGTEVTNLEEYLRAIKQERDIEKHFDDVECDTLKTYQEFVHYLNEESIGDTKSIIEAFDTNEHNKFIGYVEVKKHIVNNNLMLEFEVDACKLNAEWQAYDNFGVWQQSDYFGDSYTGYMLLPTHKDNKYFCLWYKC
jgi:hypothetical protein